jgi:hypothetical protein
MRPPEMTSAMAISSARRTGLSLVGSILPSSKILARLVTRPNTAAERLTATSMHDGVLWCSLIIKPSKPTSSAH